LNINGKVDLTPQGENSDTKPADFNYSTKLGTCQNDTMVRVYK